jgi:glyoxylase-like metal-dependent hydrolase (beta-lactamase superfamily II)
MQRERVADDIYVFTSDVYAQVTAGAVITSDGAILIDTLLFPEETRSIRLFVEGRLGSPIKYVINTHYHADHTYGTCFFPGATVVAHSRCYDLLDSRGRPGLEKAQVGMPELNGIQVVLPPFRCGIPPATARIPSCAWSKRIACCSRATR